MAILTSKTVVTTTSTTVTLSTEEVEELILDTLEAEYGLCGRIEWDLGQGYVRSVAAIFKETEEAKGVSK